MKAGASTVEPVAEEDSNRSELCIQGQPRANRRESMVVLGNVANREVEIWEATRIKTLDKPDL